MVDTVTAAIRYVRRDNNRLATEKPYILHYDAPAGLPPNNFTIESFPGIQVRNLRSAGLRYEDHGMALARLDDAFVAEARPEHFDDDDWIEKHYLPALHRSVCAALGAKSMTVFDWMLRKRSPSFPKRNVGETDWDAVQPSLSAHIGVFFLSSLHYGLFP